MLVKRIVGVEGDLVMTLPPYPDPVVRVPPGHLWVEGSFRSSQSASPLTVSLGDEPFHSDDSNILGPVRS